MKFLTKFYCIFSILMMHVAFAQNVKDGLSDGNLNINGKQIPVKIFSTTNYGDFADFSGEPKNNNSLVILNSTLNEYVKTPAFVSYKASGFEVLDKNFQPVKEDQSQDFKYLFKPLNAQDQIQAGSYVKLDTSFTIWNPRPGIQIGSFTLHFYSLMFVIAFGLGYVIMSRIFKIDNVNQKYLEPLFTWTLVGTILGARLGHVIFYQPELFKQDFWSIFLPIQTKPEFKFTGFSGLASHGATIAVIITTLYYSYKIIKKNPLWVLDRVGIVVALGGAFVRLGNFFNSEIIGKPAGNSPFAIFFPQQSSEYGITVPRYPTQLFEAAGYVLLFILLWILYRKTNKKYQQGWLFGLFFIILWAIRFFVEFLKEPQGDEFIQIGGLNTGQVLSIPFMIAGLVIMVLSKNYKITQAENEKPE